MNTGVVAADHLITDAAGVLSPGWMEISDGRIVALHQGRPQQEAPLLCEAGGVVMPAFVNAHAHLALGSFGGIGDDLPFAEWLRHAMIPAIERGTADREIFASGAAQSIAMLVAGGVGCVADSFLDPASVPLLAGSGMRAFFGLEVFGSRAESEDAFIAEFEEGHELPELGAPLMQLGHAPHTLFTCPPKVLTAVMAHARRRGLRCTLHVDESVEEHEFFTRGTGPLAEHYRREGVLGRYRCNASPVRQLADLGLLGPDLLAVHVVQADADDIALLAASHTPVVHCPRSNLMLACGIAPVAEMLAAGVTLALGTDSLASVPTLDMFEEMRTLLLVQRGQSRSTTGLGAIDAFHAATLGGARALGLDKQIGTLEAGKRADFVRLELPVVINERRDPVSRVVWEGQVEQVTHTFVDGRDLLAELSE
ncbi:MAG: hypothetical protein EXS14_07440 [Planctomycetes bacterium]|nr:hypothetical protein [Planctomycetota bacterium]